MDLELELEIVEKQSANILFFSGKYRLGTIYHAVIAGRTERQENRTEKQQKQTIMSFKGKDYHLA